MAQQALQEAQTQRERAEAAMQEAMRERDLAEHSRRQAEEAVKKARERSELHLYREQLRLAQQEWEKNGGMKP